MVRSIGLPRDGTVAATSPAVHKGFAVFRSQMNLSASQFAPNLPQTQRFARQAAQKAVLHYLAIPYDLFFVRQRVSTPSRFCPSCGSEVDLKNSPTVSFNAPVQAPAPGSAGSSPNQSARTSSSSGLGYEARYVPGATLAERYRIVSPLGKGGMGEVYRAEDMKLGQTVALKFLPQSLAKNPDALSRFTREVRLARQISHLNVCRVFDLGEIVDALAS